MLVLSVLFALAFVEGSKRVSSFGDREGSPKRLKYELSGTFYTKYRAGDRKAVREFLDNGDDTIVNEALFPFFAEQGDTKLFKETLANRSLIINSLQGLEAYKKAVFGGSLSIVQMILEDERLDVGPLTDRILKQQGLFPTLSIKMITLILRHISPTIYRLTTLADSFMDPHLEPSETDKTIMTESIVLCLADVQAYPDAFTESPFWQNLSEILTENDLVSVELLKLVELCRKDSVQALEREFPELSLFQLDFLLEASKRGKHTNVTRHLQRMTFDHGSKKTVEELKSWTVELMEHGYHQIALCNKACIWAMLRLLNFRTYFAEICFPQELQLELLSRIYYEFLQ